MTLWVRQDIKGKTLVVLSAYRMYYAQMNLIKKVEVAVSEGTEAQDVRLTYDAT